MTSLLPAAADRIEPELSHESDKRWGPFAVTVLAGWVLLLGVVAGIGVLLTGPLADTSLLRWDRQYPATLEQARVAWLNLWTQYCSDLGATLTVIGVGVAVGVVLLIARRWASVVLLATALLVEVTVFVPVTMLISRSRPDVRQLDVAPPTASFPSGHTAAATALWLTLAVLVGWNFRSVLLRWVAWTVAVLVGPVVAFSRVYRGMHHPTDVMAGLLLGLASVVVAYLAVRTWVGADSARGLAERSTVLEERV